MVTRESWLKERRSGVGASEVAAILGEDPRRGALAVYADKVADKPSDEDEDYLAFGRDVEAAIGRGYMRKTQRPTVHNEALEILRHPDCKVLGATRDFDVGTSEKYPAPAPGNGILETKAVGFHKAHEWISEPPLQYVIQVQVTMACARVAWGSLGALMGGIHIAEPVDLVPDPEFMTLVLERVERFWWHVTNRVPPEADAKPETRAAIRRLWGGVDGATLALDSLDLEMVEQWERNKELKSKAEENYDLAVNALAVRMGDATVGYLPDGSSFVYSLERVKAQLCACGKELRKEHVRRVPRRWWPRGLVRGTR